jgi:hypothetical protein
MGRGIHSESAVEQWRVRLSLATLFRLQLLVAPLFLAGFYSSLGPGNGLHPYVTLIAALIAPLIYVTLLVAWPLHRQSLVLSRTVISQIRQGGLYGILFCVLALGPLAVRYSIDLAISRNVSAALELIVVIAYALLHYVVIGSAIGGAVGIVRELIVRFGRGPEPVGTQY